MRKIYFNSRVECSVCLTNFWRTGKYGPGHVGTETTVVDLARWTKSQNHRFYRLRYHCMHDLFFSSNTKVKSDTTVTVQKHTHPPYLILAEPCRSVRLHICIILWRFCAKIASKESFCFSNSFESALLKVLLPFVCASNNYCWQQCNESLRRYITTALAARQIIRHCQEIGARLIL
jgi:hypothetical protein